MYVAQPDTLGSVLRRGRSSDEEMALGHHSIGPFEASYSSSWIQAQEGTI